MPLQSTAERAPKHGAPSTAEHIDNVQWSAQFAKVLPGSENCIRLDSFCTEELGQIVKAAGGDDVPMFCLEGAVYERGCRPLWNYVIYVGRQRPYQKSGCTRM